MKIDAYLMSEYTFGLELEAFLEGDDRYDFDSDKQWERIKSRELQSLFNKQVPGGTVKEDASLEPDYQTDFSFEWVTPPLHVKPSTMQKLRKLLEALPDENIYTNKSCGLHIHVGFPFLSEDDMIWIMVNLAMDESMQRKLSKFHRFNFFSDSYASLKRLDELSTIVNSADWNDIQTYKDIDALMDNHKEELLRLHPQGTLEWRGPRNFLQSKQRIQLIGDFIFRIYEWIYWINKTLENDMAYDGSISRKAFEKQMKAVHQPKIVLEHPKFAKEMKESTIKKVAKAFPWLKKATVENALVTIRGGKLVWINGIWHSGVWEDGIWQNGIWENGTWLNGKWYNGTFNKGVWKNGEFLNGKMKNAMWKKGVWRNGNLDSSTWMDGDFLNGETYDVKWFGGTWHNGKFFDGLWKAGDFRKGMFEESRWEGGRFGKNAEWMDSEVRGDNGKWIEQHPNE